MPVIVQIHLKKRQDATTAVQSMEKVELNITKSLGYDGSGGLPTVPPDQGRWGNGLPWKTSQERISIPLVPF